MKQEYRIVSVDYDKLAEVMNRMMAAGWRPQGGISCMPRGSAAVTCVQAMVRDIKPGPSEVKDGKEET